MVRNSRKSIIENELLYTEAEILSIKFNKAFIKHALSDKETQVSLLAKMRLNKNEMNCDKCPSGLLMNLINEKKM
jgi:hypothetical protein